MANAYEMDYDQKRNGLWDMKWMRCTILDEMIEMDFSIDFFLIK